MFPENAFDIYYRSDNEDFPLAEKLFNIPELRQRYLAHVRTILEESFAPEVAQPILEEYADLVEEGVADDPHPHAGISIETFDDELDVVSDFIASRYALLSEHPDLSLSGPDIDSVTLSVDGTVDARPLPTQSVSVAAEVSHDSGVQGVYGYYSEGPGGGFTRIELLDDGENNDGAAGDEIYGGTIPAFPIGSLVRYYVEAVATDGAGSASYSPVGAEQHDVYFYRVQIAAQAESGLVINEIMSDNETIAVDEFDEFDDWIELYNGSGQAINLEGYGLTDRLNDDEPWIFPAVTIDPGEYLIVWTDNDEEQGELHATFSVSKDGEDLVLLNPEGLIIDALTLGELDGDQSAARQPDGSGGFIIAQPSFAEANPSN